MNSLLRLRHRHLAAAQASPPGAGEPHSPSLRSCVTRNPFLMLALFSLLLLPLDAIMESFDVRLTTGMNLLLLLAAYAVGAVVGTWIADYRSNDTTRPHSPHRSAIIPPYLAPWE